MPQVDNMLKWCLNKAKKEGEKHRGLKEIEPNQTLADQHVEKSQHYLDATDYLLKGGYGDISVSSVFYSMYHCLLAILSQQGYESRNQQCTFAAIEVLIKKKKLILILKQ